jgi:hypothetical protein
MGGEGGGLLLQADVHFELEGYGLAVEGGGDKFPVGGGLEESGIGCGGEHAGGVDFAGGVDDEEDGFVL